VTPVSETTKEPQGAPKPHDRNDAFLSNWVEDFERVVKDAWTKLGVLLGEIDKRVTALENRVSDTYTWGQKGELTVEEPEEGEEPEPTLLALPLRIVRKEEILECTAAAEKPGAGGVLIVQHQASGPIVVEPPVEPPVTPRADEVPDEVPWTDVATLALDAEMKFLAVTLTTPFKMAKDDTLRVVIAEVGEAPEDDEDGALADVVVQARCR
jgi:hypothetical protein